MSTPGAPRPPEQSPKYWLGLLWGVWRKILVFSFAGLGVVLLLRFGPRAALILLPVGVLCFGTTLFAWVVLKMRGKR